MRKLFYIIYLFLLVAPETGAQQGKGKLQTSVMNQVRQGSWRLQVYDDDIIRVSFQQVTDPRRALLKAVSTGAVVAKPEPFEVERHSGEASYIYSAGAWQITNDSMEGRVTISHPGIPSGISLSFPDPGATPSRGCRIALQPGEQIYGGGERAISMNRRGHRLELYNQPAYGYAEGATGLNFSVPFFLSSRGYAVFFDNPSRGFADIGKSDTSVFETGFSHGAWDIYIVAGSNMDEQLRNYTRLTGRQPLPPRWAFGNFMSRFGYTSQEEVLSTVNRMQEEKFPVDAVILDLFWFGDSIRGTLGNLDWVNSSRWPDPKAMIDTLRNRKIKLILITEPFILRNTKNFGQATPFLATDSAGKPYMLKDFYFGEGGLLDLFRKQARDWFWKKYDVQVKKGVAGWWGDLGEPEKHPNDLFHDGRELGSDAKVPADAVHNIYAHYWSKFLFDKYQQSYPKQRLFFLNRSGFAGSQRYGIFPWSGDVSRSWSGLRAQVPLLQGMSVSGIPYIHSDAGGFAGGEKDAELYTRWLQFAAFTPIFRPHGTVLGNFDSSTASIPSEPVFWPDSTKAIVRRYIQLRYDLLPYNYNLAYEQTSTGRPLIRPMNYYNYTDSNLAQAGGQYMWGDQLLVAPVTEKGAQQQRIYLPPGKWYNYFTNRSIEGGQWISEKLTINNIPVYAKAGSFVPTRPLLLNTETYKTRYLLVRHYIGEETGRYVLYDDDGADPKALLTGGYERIAFLSQPVKNGLALRIGSDDNRYKGRVIKKIVIMDFIGLFTRPSAIKIDGMLVPFRSKFDEREPFRGQLATWDPVNEILRVVFEYTGIVQKMEINQ